MLQSIREQTQGWIAGTIVTIIIITFALWGIHSYFIGGGVTNVVASVNGTDITREQLTVAYDRIRRQAQTQYGSNPIPTQEEAALKDRALKALIDVEVLKQASSDQGFQVSDRQVDNYLQSMPEFQVNGQFSVERFQEILSSTMLSTGEFLDLIKTSMLIDQPKLGIIFSSFALPEETVNTIALVNQERDIDYINLPLQLFLTNATQIPTAKIKAYYEQHQAEFMTPEQVNVEYLELSLHELAKQINPTDVALRNFYSENINAYSQPTAWKLNVFELPVNATMTADEAKQIQLKVANAIATLKKNETNLPKDFVQTISAKDWLSLNQIPVEIQNAVSVLTKAGQVSEPIKTSKGLTIVKVLDVKEPTIQSFEAVKDKVKETYVRQHAEEKFAELREKLADLTYEHPDSLQLASQSLNLPIKTSELFTKEKVGKDIAQYKKVRDTAFSNDVINLQNNSDVIQLNPETIIVLRMKSHINSNLLPLNGVSQQITEKLKNQEAEATAAKFAENLKNQLQKGANVQSIMATNRLNWTKVGFIGRYANKVDPAILDGAFQLPHPSNNKITYGVTRLTNGFAVIAVKAVKPGTVADEKQRQVFAEQVQNSEGLLEYELYKQSQTSSADISMS